VVAIKEWTKAITINNVNYRMVFENAIKDSDQDAYSFVIHHPSHLHRIKWGNDQSQFGEVISQIKQPNNCVSHVSSDAKDEEQVTSISIGDMTKPTPGDPGVILIQVLPKITAENEKQVKEHMKEYAKKMWCKNKKGSAKEAQELTTPETKKKASPMKTNTVRVVRQKLNKDGENKEGENMDRVDRSRVGRRRLNSRQ